MKEQDIISAGKSEFLINGFKAAENISGLLSLGVAVENTRFMLFYPKGYGKDLSTYHIRTNYYGFGVELR